MALLAVAGWRVHESQAARNAMVAVLRDPLRGTLVHHKTVRLWDVASHRPLGGPMTGHIDAVNAVAFTPDGRTMATGSSDRPRRARRRRGDGRRRGQGRRHPRVCHAGERRCHQPLPHPGPSRHPQEAGGRPVTHAPGVGGPPAPRYPT
ncbi:hypothetical protein [Nonomuraea sp. NPDC049129]|uniref:WD40 repeat domain-containing protein n=1 Tax=Nonomuraea sp. NPDC049129 TaxID=3155272 RepID=UPI0033CC9AA3